jgi:hypothetical protein
MLFITLYSLYKRNTDDDDDDDEVSTYATATAADADAGVSQYLPVHSCRRAKKCKVNGTVNNLGYCPLMQFNPVFILRFIIRIIGRPNGENGFA